MLELLAAYSLQEIAVFLIMLLFAIKGGLELFDWFKERYNERFNTKYIARNKEREIERQFQEYQAQQTEEIQRYNQLEKKIDELIYIFEDRFKKIENNIEILVNSDRDDIKSWLVEKYNFYKENPARPISHHTMDTIERRYSHYKNEGGNSYIDEIIMPGLRDMAKEEQRVEL